MNLPEILEYVPRFPEPIETFLAYLSLLLIFGWLIRRNWKVWSWLLRPLAVRWRRWLGRRYVENALKSLTKDGMEVPLSGERYKVEIRWAESEGVDVLLDEGALIVNMPYAEELEHVIAKGVASRIAVFGLAVSCGGVWREAGARLDCQHRISPRLPRP